MRNHRVEREICDHCENAKDCFCIEVDGFDQDGYQQDYYVAYCMDCIKEVFETKEKVNA